MPSTALAGTLAPATFVVAGANSVPSLANTRYDWGFTTATTANLSRVTASVPAGTSGRDRFLALDWGENNRAATPDSPANSITGELDLRARVEAENWVGGGGREIVGKLDGAAMSYWFGHDNNGSLTFGMSSDGSNSQWFTSTVLGFSSRQESWVRVTYRPAAGEAVFYTSVDGATWTLISTHSYGNLWSIYDSSAPVTVGDGPAWSDDAFAGRIYQVDIRNGIGGSLAHRFDPDEAPATSPSSWTSSTGEVWTVNRAVTTRLPADIAAPLTVQEVSGLPAGGRAVLRMIDQTATYAFTGTSIVSATPCTMVLQGFTNTATSGDYASVITTYDAASTPVAVDSATTAAASIGYPTRTVDVTGTVAPTLTFTVAGRPTACNGQRADGFQSGSSATTVALGNLTPAVVAGAAQDLEVSTNAGGGFVVQMRTTAPAPNPFRTAAGNFIADVAGTRASPSGPLVAGTEAFGYTSSDVATPFTADTWARVPAASESVIVAAAGTTLKSACVGFAATVSNTTVAGSYSVPVIYTAVPTF